MPEIYMDYAAATPMDNEVLKSMKPYYAKEFYNPSSSNIQSRQVNDQLNGFRAKVAEVLGAKTSEIIFTAGGTEANNMAIKGVAWQNPKTHIVISALEHESVLNVAKYLKNNGWRITEVKPDGEGIINPNEIAKAITNDTVLVSVMLANNEIGTVQPVRQISKVIDKVKNNRLKSGVEIPIYLHTDACQAANFLDLHVYRLGVDLMTLNGGKIYGPKQSGALYVNSRVKITPLIHGGGQEFNLRSGTQNVAAIAGFATALKISNQKRKQETTRLKHLQNLFITKLQESFPDVIINGSNKFRLPNNVHVTFSGQDNERLMFALDERGILCSIGSACSASKEESSHVLKAIGKDDNYARSSLRFTMGRQTDEQAVNKVVKSLVEIIK